MRRRVAVGTYKYAAGNAATGLHGLKEYVPKGSIVTKVWGYGPTALTSSGLMGVLLGTGVMIASTGNPAGGATFGATPKLLKAYGASGAGGTMYYTGSVDKEITLKFTSNVTAGTFKVIVEYIVL